MVNPDAQSHILNQRIEPQRLKLELNGLALQAGRLEHILNELRQPIRFFINDG